TDSPTDSPSPTDTPSESGSATDSPSQDPSQSADPSSTGGGDYTGGSNAAQLPKTGTSHAGTEALLGLALAALGAAAVIAGRPRGTHE
ncbi:MAG: LPXTG cell wall anchor domain-containing protein, partial [Actinomycetes bacterium]